MIDENDYVDLGELFGVDAKEPWAIVKNDGRVLIRKQALVAIKDWLKWELQK